MERTKFPISPGHLRRSRRISRSGSSSDPAIGAWRPETKLYAGASARDLHALPFQIIQGTDKILVGYEFADVARVVYFGKMGPSAGRLVDGESVGRFVGDTLQIAAEGFNDQTWFDRAGNFHSEQLKVVERFTPVSPYHLAYEATIENPKVFTRPWKMSFPLYRRMERGARLLEFKCVEFSEEFFYRSLRRQPGR